LDLKLQLQHFNINFTLKLKKESEDELQNSTSSAFTQRGGNKFPAYYFRQGRIYVKGLIFSTREKKST